MSDEGATAVETTAPVATAPAPAKKKVVRKKTAAPKAAKKVVKSAKKTPAAKKKAVKKTRAAREPGVGRSDDTRDTIRLRMFKLLKKNPKGLTGAQVKEKLELTGVPNILRDEGIIASPPRIRRQEIEGVRGVVYQLTAAGLKAIEKGTVNSEAPTSAGGQEWPSGR